MFLLDEALYKLLTTNSDLVAAIGKRVYPNTLPPKVIFPAIVYLEAVGSDHICSLRGPSGLKRTTMRLIVDAREVDFSSTVAKRVAELARLALVGFRGTVFSDDSPAESIRIWNIKCIRDWDVYEDPTKTDQSIKDYRIWADEKRPTA